MWNKPSCGFLPLLPAAVHHRTLVGSREVGYSNSCPAEGRRMSVGRSGWLYIEVTDTEILSKFKTYCLW